MDQEQEMASAMRGDEPSVDNVLGYLRAANAELERCENILIDARYMDEPDGGDATISEQLSRMFAEKDAEVKQLRKALQAMVSAQHAGLITEEMYTAWKNARELLTPNVI